MLSQSKAMNRRSRVTATDLFVLLEREFHRRKPRGCEACYVPLPFRVPGRANGVANWQIVPPAECESRCAFVLEDIARKLQSMYALA